MGGGRGRWGGGKLEDAGGGRGMVGCGGGVR